MSEEFLSVRIGTVQAIDAAACRVDVAYDDLEQTATGLPVLQHGAGGNGQAYWLPAVGERVVTLHLSLWSEFAFVIGSYYLLDGPPPAGADGLRYVAFPDGAEVRWQSGAPLQITAPHGVEIDGPLTVHGTIDADGTVTGSEVQAGLITLTGHVHICAAPGDPSAVPTMGA